MRSLSPPSAGRWMIFGDCCPSAAGRRQSARGGGRRAPRPVLRPPPPRPGCLIKCGARGGGGGSGAGAAAALSESGSSRHCSAGRARSAGLSARSKGFPPGPCAAASSLWSCWRWSSARRPGGRPPRCRRARGPCWTRCTRVATTGRWVSVPRAPVLGGTPALGRRLCTPLSPSSTPPPAPPPPCRSREAVGPRAASACVAVLSLSPPSSRGRPGRLSQKADLPSQLPRASSYPEGSLVSHGSVLERRREPGPRARPRAPGFRPPGAGRGLRPGRSAKPQVWEPVLGSRVSRRAHPGCRLLSAALLTSLSPSATVAISSPALWPSPPSFLLAGSGSGSPRRPRPLRPRDPAVLRLSRSAAFLCPHVPASRPGPGTPAAVGRAVGRPAGRNPTAFPHLAGGQRPPIVTPGLSPAPSLASVWRMPSFQLLRSLPR